MTMVNYQPGDFCRATLCKHFKNLQTGDKKACEVCGAYRFHDYLNRRGFHITKDILEFRPFIRWAAGLMEMCLVKNESGCTKKRQKTAWETKSPSEIMSKIFEEFDEFKEAYDAMCPEEKRTREGLDHLRDEAVDLAVTVMMLPSLFDAEMSRMRRGYIPQGGADE